LYRFQLVAWHFDFPLQSLYLLLCRRFLSSNGSTRRELPRAGAAAAPAHQPGLEYGTAD